MVATINVEFSEGSAEECFRAADRIARNMSGVCGIKTWVKFSFNGADCTAIGNGKGIWLHIRYGFPVVHQDWDLLKPFDPRYAGEDGGSHA